MKPIGAYGVSATVPPWVSFGMLDPAQPLPPARPGFGWIVQIGFHESPLLPAGPLAGRVRAQLEASGHWSDVLAFVYGEEWYERLAGGEWRALGLADTAEGRGIVRDYLGRQQRDIVAATGKPCLWITTIVTADRQPPDYTGFVGVDRYPVDGESLADWWGPHQSTEDTCSLPLVAMPRWFRNTTAFQGADWTLRSAEPTRVHADWYARLVERPRWVASLGFLWQSRPYAGLVGLEDMPEVRAAYERAMRVSA